MSCNWHLPLTPIFCTALLQLSLGHSFLCSCTAVACQRSRITHCRFLTQSRSASCADPVWATPNAVFTAAVELSLSSSSPFWGCIQQELDACSTCSFPYRFVSLLLSGGGGGGSEPGMAVHEHVVKRSIHHIFPKPSDALLSLEVCSASPS